MDKGLWFKNKCNRDAAAKIVERGYAISKVTERWDIRTKLYNT